MFLTLMVCLIILQALDFFTTSKILSLPGGHEQNPIMAKGFDKFGVGTTFLIKGIAVVGAGYFLGAYNLDMLIGLDLVYSAVIAYNLRSLGSLV